MDDDRTTIPAPARRDPGLTRRRAGGDRVRRPVLLIHGVRDGVDRIDDVTALADDLRERGLPVRLLALDGVGHHVSGPAPATALEAELDAYRGVL